MSRPRHRLTRSRFGRTMETGQPVAAPPLPKESMSKQSHNRRLAPVLLTLLTVAMLGLVGAYASAAVLSDEVALVGVEAHGGTLDLTVATDAGTDSVLTFGGTGAKMILPGSSRSSNFTITNTGSIPATFRFVSDASDASDLSQCFEYALSDSEGAPVVAPGPFTRNVVAKLGVFEPGTPQQLTLTVTALDTCSTNAAQGTLVAKITAVQWSGANS
ncbi:MAG: hypothetical protein JWM90_2814 [Thermoleophilia bacterium]|nr:hypothetical protein [Thermoleophilia bacterium]